MKLIYCLDCDDIVRLTSEKKYCYCGRCYGYYTDKLNAIYHGKNVIPLGFDNLSFMYAISEQPTEGRGKEFNAFVIPSKCDTFKKE